MADDDDSDFLDTMTPEFVQAKIETLEALMHAHREAGQLEEAARCYRQLAKLKGLIGPEADLTEEPLWDVTPGKKSPSGVN